MGHIGLPEGPGSSPGGSRPHWHTLRFELPVRFDPDTENTMKAQRILAGLLLLLGLSSAAAAQERGVRVDLKRGSISASYGRGEIRRAPRSYGRRHTQRRSFSTRRIWVAGRYELVNRRVHEPAYIERIWIDPVYETRYDPCGRARRVLICDGYWKKVRVPARWVNKRVRVWKPGYWRTVRC